MCKYMLLQNNCINNSVTNGLKHKEEKKTCKTTLYDKIKDRREAGVNGEWLIWVHRKNIPCMYAYSYLLSVL